MFCALVLNWNVSLIRFLGLFDAYMYLRSEREEFMQETQHTQQPATRPFVHVICCWHVFLNSIEPLGLAHLEEPFNSTVFIVPNTRKTLLFSNMFKYLLKTDMLFIVVILSGMGCIRKLFNFRYVHNSMIIKQCCQNQTEHFWNQPYDCLLEDP